MSSTVNMSLDDIIKQNKTKTRGVRGMRGRGRGRGRGGSGGRGGILRGTRGGGVAARTGIKRGRGRGRGGAQARISRIDTMNNQTALNRRSRSQSRRGRSISRARSQSRNKFQQNANNNQQRGRSRSRGALRSRSRSIGTAAVRSRSQSRGRGRGRGGITTRGNLRTRGISTQSLRSRGGISKMRSDQIIKAQKLNYVQQKVNRARRSQFGNLVPTQTFTRSKSPGNSTLTVRVANNATNRRRPLNRNPKIGYLDQESLARLAAALGGTSIRRGPGSVRSMNSNRSRRSTRSNRSFRGRGRGRGFASRQVLNPRLQMEIAAIQGKSDSRISTTSTSQGVNFTPVPHLTTTTLSQRFSSLS